MPAAGSPPPGHVTSPVQETTSIAPEAMTAQLGVGRWGTYVRIAIVVALVSSAVVVALLFAARPPADAESATRSLATLARRSATPGAQPSVAPSETPTAVPIAVSAAAPMAIPTEAPTPTASASPTPAPAASEGTISTPPSAAGHRVFVDGRYAGDSPGPLKVRCGPRAVKVGSGGTARTVDVPCGGDVVVPTR